MMRHDVSPWNVRKLPVLKDQKRIDPRASDELFARRVDTLIRELESSMVDRNAGPGGQDLMGFHRLIRRHMHWRHEPAGLVCANRQKRQAQRRGRNTASSRDTAMGRDTSSSVHGQSVPETSGVSTARAFPA